MEEKYNPLAKRPGESELDHHRRLVYGKMNDKTLSDYDYAELSRYVYGEDLSADSVRKWMYGSKRTLELMDKERMTKLTGNSMDYLKELEDKTAILKREQQKFSDQRREYNKLLALEGRREHLEARLVDAANNLALTIGTVFDRVPVYTSVMDEEKEAVLVFSDWHYGMKTDNVFNRYDTDVCIERVRKTVYRAIDRIQTHGCSVLHVVILGDLVHGNIHVSARVASEELACDQLMQVSEIMAQAIEMLSGYVDKTYVYSTYGNHARMVQNKQDSIHRDNMERLIPWWLTQRFKGSKNITIMPCEDNEFLFINSCGHEICASHGDLDSVRTSPRLLATLFHKKYGKNIEYILLGDKHHRESFDELGVTAMVCGSLCGTDDFANEKRLYSKPEQLLLIINKECGVDAEYKLKC